MRISSFCAVIAAVGVLLAGGASLSEELITLRNGLSIDQEAAAPPLPKVENHDKRRVRNFAEQPPTIPHTIRGYEVTRNANKCLSCHSRIQTGESQAPMVSVTHFMDRDNQVLATVSPRRYFCNQCHVVQEDVKPLVNNDFVDVELMLRNSEAPQ